MKYGLLLALVVSISACRTEPAPIVAIGAPYNGGNGSEAGHTRVYAWDGTQWSQRGADIDGEAEGDGSGYSVSLSSDGNVVAIGAPGNDGNGSWAGHTRVYAWDGTQWSQRGADIDGEPFGDESGSSVSLSSDGNVVAIGAPNNDGNGDGDRVSAGRTRVYAWDGTRWSQRGADIDGEAAWDFSGNSVSLSSDGNVVAIGAPGIIGLNAGHTRVYAWDGTQWSQRGADIEGEAAGDLSGSSVSLSSDGNVVAIGARYNDGNGSAAGHTRVYVWDGTQWTQRGPDIDGKAEGDWSGDSVSLSSDGNVVAIGAPNNDGNGSWAGHTRVYAWDGTQWSQRGSDIDGERVRDNSGSSVSLSSDGNVVAIGAPGNGYDSGHTRVYAWDGTQWSQRGADIDGEAAEDLSGYSVSL